MPLKERLTPGRVPTEFDKFADTYADLLKDPIRDRFAGSGDTFFYSRKLNVLSAFLNKSERQSPAFRHGVKRAP